MNLELSDITKGTAYILWEMTDYDDPLHLWQCAEDIACYFESNNILDEKEAISIINEVNSARYSEVIRNISYRLFLYTKQNQSVGNWICAEKLINNNEWRSNILKLAQTYHLQKGTPDFHLGFRNEKIREYYAQITNK